MSKIEFTEQGYEKEMEILRKKIDTIDEKIIKFIIAISQKIKGTLSRGIIKISIQTSDGNKKKVQYTLNSFDEDKQFFREGYDLIVDEIEKITLNSSSNWGENILKHGLLNLIFTRMQYSLEVAKIKLNYKKEILDIERRNKMVGGRVEKVYIYREDEEFVDKIKKIFKYIHDESCIMQLVHFLSKGENIDIDEFMKKLEEK